MSKIKLPFFGKLVIILVISFFATQLLIKNVFLANSPKIRSDMYTRLAKLLPFFKTPNNIPAINNIATLEYLKNNMKPVAKGVNAASKGSVGYVEYKMNEVEWVEVTYTLSTGKTITVKSPKGMPLPDKKSFE